MPRLTRKHYLAYVSICLVWGSTWGAIRLLVLDVPPFRAAAIRFVLAAAILFAVLLSRKRKLHLPSKQWRALVILGFMMMGLPYGLLFWAEYRISSSMTAVLFSACPLVVALFTPLMTRTRVPRRAVFAMLIGLGGIATLFYSQFAGSVYLLAGGAAVMLALVSSSWASVFAKRELGGVDPFLGTGVQFLVSAVVLFAMSLLEERGYPSSWSATSVSALIFLSVFGSVISFTTYYWLLQHMHAYQLSTINLIVPVIAMIEGAVFLHEAVPLTMMGAALLVLVAVAAVLRADDDQPLKLELNTPVRWEG